MKRYAIELKDVTNQDVSGFDGFTVIELVKLMNQLNDIKNHPTTSLTDKLSVLTKVANINTIELKIIIDELLNSLCFTDPQLYVNITKTTVTNIDISGNTKVYKPQ